MSARGVLPVLALFLIVLTACSSAVSTPSNSPAASPANSTSPALATIIDAARKEGELDLVWGEGSLGGTQGAAELAAAFNAQYGLNTKVQFTPGPTDVEMASKLVQEYQTQRKATTDVYHGSATPIMPLIQAQALEEVDWASWAPNVKAESLAPKGAAVSVQTELPGILYNSSKLSSTQAPHSMQDLLKPEFKGRVASTPYASGFDGMAGAWGEQRTLDYVKAFSPQLAGLIRCTESSRVLSGEFDVLAFDCNQSNGLEAKEQGKALGFTIPSDIRVVYDLYLAVPKNAAHPNLAKLWINFVMSQQGQSIIYKHDFMDSAAVPGSKTAELENSMQSSAPVTRVDVAFYQQHDEKALQATVKQVVDLLQKK